MLDKRAYCYYDHGRRYCRRSRWGNWGRWVLLGIIIFFALIFLFLLLCMSRRRARRGVKPYYGTGWAVGRNYQQPQQQQYQYSQQQNGYYGGQNEYNNNNTGVPPQYGGYQQGGYAETGVTQPKPTYGGETQYAPPPGPPPR